MTQTAKAKRGNPVVGVVVLIVVGLALFGWLKGRIHGDPVPGWCRSQVHVGERLGQLKMPGAPHLVSISNGNWTYDDGVVITFLNGQVYTKTCG